MEITRYANGGQMHIEMAPSRCNAVCLLLNRVDRICGFQEGYRACHTRHQVHMPRASAPFESWVRVSRRFRHIRKTLQGEKHNGVVIIYTYRSSLRFFLTGMF